MKQIWMRRLFAIAMICCMAMGQSLTAFAELDGESVIVISGDGIYEVEAGKTNEVELQVKNKGTGAAEKISFEPKATSALSPVRARMKGTGTISALGSGNYKTVTMLVTVDSDVDEPTFELPMEYTYNSRGGDSRSGSTTIYLKIKGFEQEPDFALQDMKLSPETMSPGSGANLNGAVVNTGGKDMYQVEVLLDNLTTDGISLSGGFNSKMFSKLAKGSKASFSFPLVAAADMAAGNYPVSIKLKYQDEFGKEYEKTSQYYINVGGVAGRKADLVIRNMKEPGGSYGVNQNFTVSFDLCNNGKVTAKDIVITASPVDASAVVPKSSSMKTIHELAPGASSHQSFTFAGTAASTSQNYAIEFTVEYTSGGTAVTTFRQFAGVNVSNPDNDEDGKTSKPKIIVSDYQCDPLIVMAGEEFDLKMTLLNTHREKTVSNIKMFLTLSEETSSDSEKSGNIFTPVNSSNTFYFDSIRPKGTVEKSLKLYVVPNAQPKTYTLTVNFEYEDGKGNEYTAAELLGINVKQATELQIDEFSVPETVEQFQPVSVAFSYYNTGKVDLSNVMIRVEGDVDCDSKNTFIGNLEQGESDYYEVTFMPNTIGEVPVAIVISYEDPSGETIEERRELLLNVMEPYIPEDMPMEEEPAMDMGKVVTGIVVLGVLAALLVLFVKKQKEPPKSAGESISAAEEIEDEEDDYEDEEIIVTEDKEGMPL